MDRHPFDLTDPDLFAGGVPHDLFARLRREEPVHWHPEPGGQGFWALTRHEDVVAASRDPETFSSERGGTFLWDQGPEELASSRQLLLNMDPPRHTRYRLIVNRGFTPKRVRAMEPAIREQARQIVDRFVAEGGGDFVEEVAAELPLRVIAELMGVPAADRHQLFDWSNRLIGAQDPELQPTPDDGPRAAAELYQYAHDLAAERRREPRDDLVTTLLEAEVDGERLTEHERDMFFVLFAVGGNETTRNSISHGMLALIEHPDQRRRLLEAPDLLDAAVEEIVRWATPVMLFRRTATRDTQLRGVTIAEGDKVVMYYVSANRDEAVFAEPGRFDVGRSPNDHVAFGGGGPHYCLGASLARLEIRVLFEELLRRAPDLELAGPVERMRSNWINGIKRMPVELVGARAAQPA